MELNLSEHGRDGVVHCQYEALEQNGQVSLRPLVVLQRIVQLQFHLHGKPVVLVGIRRAEVGFFSCFLLELANQRLVERCGRHHFVLFNLDYAIIDLSEN